MSPVSTRKDGKLFWIISDNPPVNALGHAVRAGLADAIAKGNADSGVKAIVIACDGRTFFAGADITEFGKPLQAPGLPEVCDAIEASDKPVIAAIHGTALGGGLEVALACHYRVAVPSAKLGLPEVKLGLLPGAGGTQRLPRVIGAEAALGMIVSGNPVGAKTAHTAGLVDKLAEEDGLREAAAELAKDVMDRDTHPVTSRREDKIRAAKEDPGLFDRFRKDNARMIRGLDAPEACIAAVEAAVNIPFEKGTALERELFMKLVTGDQSKAMRHVFFAERTAQKIDGLPKDTATYKIEKVGILGAGTMGGGIAMNFLTAGIPVTMVEREQAALDRGTAIMRKNYDRSAAKGKFKPEQVEAAMGRLNPTLDFEALGECDLIIEAVFENMDLKKEIFSRLDQVAKPGAILASNTSYLDIDEIAAQTRRPDHVLGMHFFSPANVMKLLEVVRGRETAPAVLATAMEVGKTIGKVAVVSGVCHGFIGNRMLAARQEQANALLLEGATPWQIDDALTSFGMPMGPFQMADLAGLDIGWNPDTTSSSTVREVLCEQGRRGQKTGKGFYDYGEDRSRTPSKEVEAIIADFARKSGKTPRDFTEGEIRERLIYPMINEGAKILEEGIAQRASDIDIVWLYGYGWPAWTGGPMFWADTIGVGRVLSGLERHGKALGEDFEISPLLKTIAEDGRRFNG